MKQTMIAALAALMLAGALSAVSGATSPNSVNAVIVIGEGSAPVPADFPTPSSNSDSDTSSLSHSF